MNIFFKKFFIISAGMLVANSLIAQEFMPINGNQIQYEKKGSAQPTIIFVAGYGGPLASFDSVFDRVCEFNTVIRYSRASLGNSTCIKKINRRIMVNSPTTPSLFLCIQS